MHKILVLIIIFILYAVSVGAVPPGYPDETNTGWEHTGVSLTTYSSPCTITTNGTVIDSKDITCAFLLIRANNVTVKRSKMTMTSGGGAICNDCDAGGAFTGLLVEDVEINCANIPGTTAITSKNYTARRVHLYGCENTVWADSNVLIEDSYLHDNLPHDTPGCPLEPGPNCHTDGVQIPGGGSDITVLHNRIYGGYIDGDNFGNAAITMGGGTTNIIVNNNILAGGGYTIYCDQGGAGATNDYINNRFSTVYTSTVGGFGPVFNTSDCQAGTFEANVIHETNALLSGQSATNSPTITITAPVSDPTYSTGTTPLTTLAGTATDDFGVIWVSWSCDVCGSGNAVGFTSWSIPSVNLQSGDNVITITSHDAEEHTASDILTVTLTGGVVFLSDPTGLNLTANSTPTFLSNPTGLSLNANATPTFLGNPSGLGLSGNSTPTFLGNPTGLTLTSP